MIGAVTGGERSPARFLEDSECWKREADVDLRSLRVTCLLWVSLLLAGSGCTMLRPERQVIHPAKSLPATTPWDLAALSQPPQYEWADRQGPVWSLFYEGQAYKGKPTHVFAYYASPATLERKGTFSFGHGQSR